MPLLWKAEHMVNNLIAIEERLGKNHVTDF